MILFSSASVAKKLFTSVLLRRLVSFSGLVANWCLCLQVVSSGSKVEAGVMQISDASRQSKEILICRSKTGNGRGDLRFKSVRGESTAPEISGYTGLFGDEFLLVCSLFRTVCVHALCSVFALSDVFLTLL